MTAFRRLRLAAGLLLTLAAAALQAAVLPGERVDIGGYRLYLNCQGSGSPTVVLDSGMGGFSLEWRRVQRRLENHVRVCSYDRAGYGYSDNGPAPRTSARLAEELHRLLERANVPGPYLLVGHSFGGYNIRYFAHAYPRDTAGLVLVDASHPDQFARFPRRQLPHGSSSAGGRRIRVIQPLMSANYPEEVRHQAYMLMASHKARRAYGNEYRHFMESAAEVRDLSLPDVPILVLSRGQRVWPNSAYGDEMERIWAELQNSLGRLSDRTLHLVAANSGHLVHFDQPEAVSQAILLTATAATSHWNSWEAVRGNGNGMIAPMLAQSVRVAER